MRPHIIFICLLFSIVSNGQNLIDNGNFENPGTTLEELPVPWNGYKNRMVKDDLTNSFVGQVENGDGSIYQEIPVTSGEIYVLVFDYRWVSSLASNNNMTVRVKDINDLSNSLNIINGTSSNGFTLNTDIDQWFTNTTFKFIPPTGVSNVRILFYKGTDNKPLNIDNVYLAIEGTTSTFIDSDTPINAQPVGAIPGNWDLDFSDEFNDAQINLSKWIISESSSSRAPRPNLGVTDWWWKKENAFLDGTGNLVLRGSKVDNNTMYCGSVESRNIYEPTFGYLEARIQIAETSKGNHTAFWLQGHNQGNVDNSAADGAEVDIFESAWTNNTTKAVVHFDGYGTFKKNHTIPFNVPNIHDGYHLFGLHWTSSSMDIYYDGIKVSSTISSKPFPFTTDPNGYPLVPQVPEWLWLSVGASFADGDFQSQPIGTLSDALVDYVRVYKSSATLALVENFGSEKFILFPNPVKNIITIKSKEPHYSIQAYDLNGRIIMHSEASNLSTIDVSGFAKGLYIFKITSNEMISNHKIMVK